MEQQPSELLPGRVTLHGKVAASASRARYSISLRWILMVVVVGLVILTEVLLPTSNGVVLRLPVASDQLPLGMRAGPSAVPWSDVGRGWLIASWEPHPLRKPVITDLALVSPTGALYPLYRLSGRTPTVVDWSSDGQRVLVQTANVRLASQRPGSYETIDLRTGIVEGSFKPGGHDQDFANLTTPRGNSILINEMNGASVQWLERYSLDGRAQVRYPNRFPRVKGWDGSWLESANQAQIVMGANHGLAILDDDGEIIATLPGHDSGWCLPEALWGGGVIVASCTSNDNSSENLYLFSQDWSVPRLLAAGPRDGFGLFEAWRVEGRVLVQLQSCGPPILGELHGQNVTVLDNPGVSGIVLGTTSKSLNVLVPGGECFGGATVVDRYTPSTNKLVQVIGRNVFGGAATSVVGYLSTQGFGPGGKL